MKMKEAKNDVAKERKKERLDGVVSTSSVTNRIQAACEILPHLLISYPNLACLSHFLRTPKNLTFLCFKIVKPKINKCFFLVCVSIFLKKIRRKLKYDTIKRCKPELTTTSE